VSLLVVSGVSQGVLRGRAGRWQQVLSDVSFEVDRGEIVGIVGGALSGKTTLLSIAAGLGVPEVGSVRLGDMELTSLRKSKRAKLRGRELVWLNRAGMSQKLEVTKIVGWPLMARYRGRRETERRAAEMLERVGAADCAGRRWDDLSRWEQVLVGLAQGFVGDPTVVVVDDLLDALGTPWTEQASDLLRSLIDDTGRGCGVVMSASDRDSVVLADRVWSLEQGGRLVPTAGHYNRGTVIPLPKRNGTSESRGVGSC
jgi:predicted ABC-type transport system involved in lysophospholipase L1 biosynthesis ATPase subunit